MASSGARRSPRVGDECVVMDTEALPATEPSSELRKTMNIKGKLELL